MSAGMGPWSISDLWRPAKPTEAEAWQCLLVAAANPGYFVRKVGGEFVLTPAPPPAPVKFYDMSKRRFPEAATDPWDEQRSRIMVPMGNPQAAFMAEPWDGNTICRIPVEANDAVPSGAVFLVKDGYPVAVIYNIGPSEEPPIMRPPTDEEWYRDYVDPERA